MAQNVEIKARLADFQKTLSIAQEIADGPETRLIQEDVFFNVPQGRLKLRIFSTDQSELIYYERDDSSGPKLSSYEIFKLGAPDGLQSLLASALGIRGIVKKQRHLYFVGQTRIHLDQVEGLGDFLELEVVLRDEQSLAEGEKIAQALMGQLSIQKDSLIDCAYIDLITPA
ncbi:MAG: class IV adenylate cyclase [Pseudomonadota bacterium]